MPDKDPWTETTTLEELQEYFDGINNNNELDKEKLVLLGGMIERVWDRLVSNFLDIEDFQLQTGDWNVHEQAIIENNVVRIKVPGSANYSSSNTPIWVFVSFLLQIRDQIEEGISRTENCRSVRNMDDIIEFLSEFRERVRGLNGFYDND